MVKVRGILAGIHKSRVELELDIYFCYILPGNIWRANNYKEVF